MLLCSSKIPVIESCTAEVFVKLATEWVIESRNYSFCPFSWDGTPEFICAGTAGEVFQVGLFEEGKICAIHFCSVDNRTIKWTTDFILDTEENILAFQLYRDAPADIDFVHPAFSLPQLVHKVISAGYCALDNGIQLEGKPIIIHDEDIGWITDMMLHRTKYNLPIVYLSCERDGHCIINPYKLAEKLNGVAHVIFETTRSVSYGLRETTDGINPYAGAIEIFYPKGNRKFLPSQLEGADSRKIYTIVNALFGHLVQLRVEDRFSWSQLQSNKLRNQLSSTIQKKEEDSKDFKELEKTYEELLSEKESLIQKLTDQLNSANTTIEQLEARLARIENIPSLITGEERDLYPCEQQSMLCEILQRELRDSPENTRKHHILESLILANKCENTVAEKRRRLKDCLHGYTKMTNAIRKEMEEIGFLLSDDGKHIKVVFGEDARYTGTLSKTGSDHRAGDNIAHDLVRNIF